MRIYFSPEEISSAIATTGITGDKSVEKIPLSVICFVWRFKNESKIKISNEKNYLKGTLKKSVKKR
ncbi:hypothetical protein CAB17_19840 (plasmid) [Legionella sainthelensi]|uniref:Uncharacterized protein n=1 Tax=Legionella sainthelensi TaxID=28087 RepID=A0A2H5FRQ0_9GAMM|nr:hypothetical protein CAB17_19840 [Legionella sainthelensi]